MEDHKRQQALNNFRNALGRLEQSDFKLGMIQTETGFAIQVWEVDADPGIRTCDITTTISNHTLRLKTAK